MSDAIGSDPTEELLGLVRRTQAARLHEIEERTEREVRAIESDARKAAAVKVRAAVAACRDRRRRQLDAVRSELATRARRQKQSLERAVVDGAWPRIEAELLARWKRLETRRAWVHDLLERALRVLPPVTWIIHHPPGWEVGEIEPELARVRQHAGRSPELRVDPSLEAGLRIVAEEAMLDGTLRGLLSDRALVLGYLLGTLNALQPRSGGRG